MDVCYSFGLVVQALYIISECVNFHEVVYILYMQNHLEVKNCANPQGWVLATIKLEP